MFSYFYFLGFLINIKFSFLFSIIVNLFIIVCFLISFNGLSCCSNGCLMKVCGIFVVSRCLIRFLCEVLICWLVKVSVRLLEILCVGLKSFFLVDKD